MCIFDTLFVLVYIGLARQNLIHVNPELKFCFSVYFTSIDFTKSRQALTWEELSKAISFLNLSRILSFVYLMENISELPVD